MGYLPTNMQAWRKCLKDTKILKGELLRWENLSEFILLNSCPYTGKKKKKNLYYNKFVSNVQLIEQMRPEQLNVSKEKQ